MCKNLTGANGRAVNKLGVERQRNTGEGKFIRTGDWSVLKQSWSLCNISRGRTGSSAILIKQQSVNRANGFLRDLGEMRCGALIYSRVARDWPE